VLKNIHTDLLKKIRSGEHTDLLKNIETFGRNNRRAEEQPTFYKTYSPAAERTDILEKIQTF
jgi:hypothetical protein